MCRCMKLGQVGVCCAAFLYSGGTISSGSSLLAVSQTLAFEMTALEARRDVPLRSFTPAARPFSNVI